MRKRKILVDSRRSVEDIYAKLGLSIYREEGWRVCRSYSSFCESIILYVSKEGNFPDVISIEHDLSPMHMLETIEKGYLFRYRRYGGDTGLDCIYFMIGLGLQRGLRLPKIIIHSDCDSHKEKMLKAVNKYVNYRK